MNQPNTHPKKLTDKTRKPFKKYIAVPVSIPCKGCDRFSPEWCDREHGSPFCELRKIDHVWKDVPRQIGVDNTEQMCHNPNP